MEYKELLNPFHVFRQNILFDLISKLVTISKNVKLQTYFQQPINCHKHEWEC